MRASAVRQTRDGRMSLGARTAAIVAATVLVAAGCAQIEPRGTGDLGVVVLREKGALEVIDTSARASLGEVDGLGDLSHASVVYSRDGRYAYVFGRDGALSRVDLLTRHVVARIAQAGNSIGGAITQDGSLVAAQNYAPGGIRVFRAESLEPVADIPAVYGADGARSKVVGLADAPGNRLVFSLFDAGEIWIADLADPHAPRIQRIRNVGKQPYDGLVTPDGRYYIAGLFGEDGLVLVDLWHPERGARRILDGYGRGEERLPVYKMPHLRGWAIAGDVAWLPAVGHHAVLAVDTRDWHPIAEIPVAGQPVFVIARPDGREIWVTFALPDNGLVQVIDAETRRVAHTLAPGRAILHLEFTPRGEAVWMSSRDDDRVLVYDTRTLARVATLPAPAPSGIFFTSRAARIGF